MIALIPQARAAATAVRIAQNAERALLATRRAAVALGERGVPILRRVTETLRGLRRVRQETETLPLNQQQTANLQRFETKLPNDAGSIQIERLQNGNVVFKADVPARNVPQSFARYEKVIDKDGNTLKFTKTTFAGDGKIVHIKTKFER